jgi:hypothetical protein
VNALISNTSTSLIFDHVNSGVITRLLSRAGIADNYSLSRLAGGANNRVFRVDAPQRTVLLKSYFRHPGDRRDRCGAEWAFATAAWEIGVRAIPEPLARDPESRLSLFEFIPGRKLESHEINCERVREAVVFFLQINSRRQELCIRALPDASEACFRLADHLTGLRRRIHRLQAIDPAGDSERAAAEFMTQTLRPLFVEVLDWTTTAAADAGIDVHDELTDNERCVSASDFGFHNALLGADGRMKFIDFEYAGRDDPAKTICDFFCQPELPVPADCRALFSGEIASGLENPERLQRRLELLLPMYRLSWCCIMLNDFLPAGNERRRFAGTVDDEVRKWRQLEKARQAAEQVMKETHSVAQ